MRDTDFFNFFAVVDEIIDDLRVISKEVQIFALNSIILMDRLNLWLNNWIGLVLQDLLIWVLNIAAASWPARLVLGSLKLIELVHGLLMLKNFWYEIILIESIEMNLTCRCILLYS